MNAERALILGNLLHRPLRSLITVVAVGVEVCLVVIIVGLTTGLRHETAKRVEGVGADLLLQPPRSSFVMAITSAPMPIKIGEKLAEVPHVAAVAPVLVVFNTSGFEIVYGIELESFRRVSSGFVYHQGGPFEDVGDILVDDRYARGKGVQVDAEAVVVGHHVENGFAHDRRLADHPNLLALPAAGVAVIGWVHTLPGQHEGADIAVLLDHTAVGRPGGRHQLRDCVEGVDGGGLLLELRQQFFPGGGEERADLLRAEPGGLLDRAPRPTQHGQRQQRQCRHSGRASEQSPLLSRLGVQRPNSLV